MTITTMYDTVFRDMVKCYLEGMEEDDKIHLTDSEILCHTL